MPHLKSWVPNKRVSPNEVDTANQKFLHNNSCNDSMRMSIFRNRNENKSKMSDNKPRQLSWQFVAFMISDDYDTR